MDFKEILKIGHSSKKKCKILLWLGKGSLFQTFDEPNSIIDKDTAIKEIREVLICM